MDILLFGKNGQLGTEFQRILPKLGNVTCLDYKDVDLRDLNALQKVLYELKPDLIVNASAYTAVDRAETEQETAMTINSAAPGAMAEWARRSGAVLIHYSTDYVFDGRKNTPYSEVDPASPLNVYGRSKLGGEENIQQAGEAYLILRTSWVYSVGGTGFVNKVLEWSRNNQTMKIVSDQISNPTWARELAEATFSVISTHRDNLQDVMMERGGLYHLAGNGYTSRYEWARQILANDPNRTEQLVKTLEPASSDEFPTPAVRPLFSALDCSKFAKTFDIRLPDWRESLRKAMSE
jgi:dTDP-4-dehydrorhamnose reductase